MFRCLILSMLFLTTSINAVRVSSDYKIYRDKMLVHRKQGVPHEINYQGWLGTVDDTTGVTGTFTMQFRLYTQETGGTAVWEETHSNVNVSNGIFNVILGSVNPIPAEIFTGDALWLEVQVGDEVLAPRKKLVSVGYAIQAENAEHARYADTAGFAVDVDINYVDSAGVAVNAWRWNGNMWGVEYPKANVADTSTYADTAGYALDADVNYVDSAGVAVNAWRWNNNMWGVEYPKANIADTANYVAGTDVAGEVSQANYADTAGYALSVDINYVDSAGVSANAWRWSGNMWGVEYPKANLADTANCVAGTDVAGEVSQANYADTAGYALSANINYVDSAGVAVNAWKWNGNTWGDEYPKANIADTATYANTAGYAPDNDWVLETSPANYLRTYGDYGIARKGAVLHGSGAYTHVNLGEACTTGTAGSDWYYCTVSGGGYNTASGPDAAVGGGYGNTASNNAATVGGGYGNTASGSDATVSGGYKNIASGTYATVGGGRQNTASSYAATVGGGYHNTASGSRATVGGGQDNTANGNYATVGGGYDNTASYWYATVGGGHGNTASGYAATIPGGMYVKVTGAGSFAFGMGSSSDSIKVTGDYLVVFGDGGAHNYKFGINREDPQYPLHVGTDASNGNGAYLSPGGTWTNASSRELKEDFTQLDGKEVLDKLKSLFVCMWRYKGTNEYHIGPMAEDFYEIFGTGTDDKHLSSSDVSGVALIAIKELIRKIEAQQQVIKTQQEEIKLLKNRVAELEQLLKEGK